MQAKLLVNWYKPSGKWYSSEIINIPDNIETWDLQHVDYIEQNQTTLTKSWINGYWFMSVTCLEEEDKDVRFFECLVKYPRNI